MNDAIKQAVKLFPSVIDYLSLPNRLEARKAAPIPRDELERRLTRAIYAVDKRYLEAIAGNNGVLPFGFWEQYQRDLADTIAAPIRTQIEQSFSEANDNTYLVDTAEANSKVDAAITAAIIAIAATIAGNSRNQYASLLQEGITELTRAEGQFSNVLSDMLGELGLKTQIRLTTAVDERVCPICGPADHKLKDEPINTSTGGWNGQTWGGRFGDVPFHVNCRCKTKVETIRG